MAIWGAKLRDAQPSGLEMVGSCQMQHPPFACTLLTGAVKTDHNAQLQNSLDGED